MRRSAKGRLRRGLIRRRHSQSAEGAVNSRTSGQIDTFDRRIVMSSTVSSSASREIGGLLGNWHWTLLCLSSGVGEAVEGGGGAGGGLDAAVEPSGEGAFEAAADVSMRFALGGAFGFVGPGFVVAA